MRKILLITTLLLTSFFNITVFAQNKTEDIEIGSAKVDYTLPYPGILQDHPLYPIKKIRDIFWVFITRDNLKKANVYHLLSDKKAHASLMLTDKGKWGLAVETINEGQQDFTNAIKYYKLAKEQGSSPSPEKILDLKLSTAKHKEIAEFLLKKAPKNDTKIIKSVLEITEKINKQLEGL